MQNNIEMIENMLNTERRNRRGNREIRFEVNSNYYEAVSKLLSDYKRVLKENEQLRTEVNSLKEDKEKKAINFLKENMLDYEEIDTSILLDINLTQLNLIEKLQKENEELKEDRDKFKKALGKRITYCNELEKDLFENCSNYVIPKQIVKDKIRHYQELQDNYIKKYDEINEGLQAMINVLQELLEGRK